MANETDTATIKSWEDLDCDTNLLRGIYSYGFENPSIIQQKAIKTFASGRDTIAQAQSGTGKTGCFTIGTLCRVDPSLDTTQAVILSPTRELSQQTKDVLDNIGAFMKGLNTQLLVGGVSTYDTVNQLNSSTPHVVVGCPGKVFDMLNRGHLKIGSLKMIVLDEADEMLSHGFKEQIYNIFKYLPSDVQIGLFSATIPPSLFELTDKFMQNPFKILVEREKLSLDGIKQFYINLENDETKFNTLKDLFSSLNISQSIVYCNSVTRAKDLYSAMKMENYPVACIHSSMDTAERKASFAEFKSGNKRVLISTDVTARGIDIQQVSIVINFDLPSSVDKYLHRIGRSGRWGRKGVGINFVTKRDIENFSNIEQHYKIKIEEMPNNWSESIN